MQLTPFIPCVPTAFDQALIKIMERPSEIMQLC